MLTPATRATAPTARRARLSIFAGLLGLTTALTMSCSQPTVETAASTDSTTIDVAATDDAPAASEGARLRAAIAAAGVRSTMPDDTLEAIGEGICSQLAAGTDRGIIIANLRSVAGSSATATTTTPQTDDRTDSAAPTEAPTADQLAATIVDAAQAGVC